MGEGIVRELGINMYTLLFLKWITNKDLLYSTGNSARCCVAAGWEGSLAENIDTPICMAEFLRCLPETVTTLFVNWPYPNTKQKVGFFSLYNLLFYFFGAYIVFFF